MTSPLKIAVLISGRGSNLQALIDACAEDSFPAKIVAVISNLPNVEGLQRAEKAGIPTHVLHHKSFDSRKQFDDALHEVIVSTGANFVCLAGFMRLLTAEFTEKWGGNIINIHPSLLPKFKGANAHVDVLAAGAKETGCTVHYVTADMDSGEVILQSPPVPVLEGDTTESLAARVLKQEHVIYPKALQIISEKKDLKN